jgi:hypothetical protein
MIARRHIFHIAGFDPGSVESIHRRFCRELAAFARLWRVSASAGAIEHRNGHPCWSVTARGQSWAVTSVYEPLDWHDIVSSEIERPLPALLRDGLAAGFDIMTSGTLGRYFKSSVSYALFFLTTYLEVALLAAIAMGAGGAVVFAFGASLPNAALAAAVALTTFALLMSSLGKLWRVQQGLAVWAFARAHVHSKRPDIEERIAAFATRVAARALAGDVDEILCIGHSFGALLLIEVMAQVVARHPDIGHQVKLMLLTVGSTIPKLYLYPTGVRMRANGERVAAEPAIDWAEYQSRGDFISFYKFHPIALRRPDAATESIKPNLRRIRMREMLSPGTCLLQSMSHLRRHYQFLMANEQLASYDYFMFVCGPVPAADLVRAPRGPLDFLIVGGVLRNAEPGAM